MRVGVIHNARSHRNRTTGRTHSADVIRFAPDTPDELAAALVALSEAKVDLLIIDGGDGTVRDVLGLAPETFAELPLLAVLPHGKTNALARDLGIPAGWTIDAAVVAVAAGRKVQRRPVEVVGTRPDADILRGFIFGAGAYVGATRMAQRAHRAGLFDGLAIGATLVGAVLSTLAGRGLSAGEAIRLDTDGPSVTPPRRFLLLATTLETLPLGIRPFGLFRAGLKLLDIDAPPRRLLAALPVVLTGRSPPWLQAIGYRHRLADSLAISGLDAFVLDGEEYTADSVIVREGPLLNFVVP